LIVGNDNGANLHRILGRFSDIKKRAMEEFIESNKSRKMVNATVHFIILLSLNRSFHIYSLIVSLFEHPCGKRRDPPMVSSPKALVQLILQAGLLKISPPTTFII
jgi:hypothetical protein